MVSRHISRTEADVRATYGIPTPSAPARRLKDATVILPRCRHEGTHHSHLRNIGVHIIGRAYGHDEIFLHTSGSWRPVRTSPGAVSVFPVDLETVWHIPVANEFSAVVLPDTRLRSLSDEVGNGGPIELAERIAVDDSTTSGILNFLDGLAHEPDAQDRASNLLFERAVDLLCAQLVRTHSASRTLDPPVRRGLAPWQVKRIIVYMRERLDQDIGLSELAGLLGLSRYHFCTAFRLATGMTPHESLTSWRIKRARELLANPSLPITDIALNVGYGTPSAFSASFRKLVGVTPSEYRRRIDISDKVPGNS